MTTYNEKADVFEQYEQLPISYHRDPRWEVVRELRKQNKHLEANGLVFQIRNSWGFNG